MASGNIIVIKPSKDFELIPGSIIRELSPEIVGIYCKVVSFGHGWNLNIKGLSAKTGISEGKLRKAFALLIDCGIIERKPDHTNGRLNGWKYIVHGEISVSQNSVFTKNSNTENSEYCDFSNTENCEGINNISKDINIHKEGNIKDNMVKPFNFRESLIEIGVSEEVADAYMQVRKMKRAANTEIAFKALYREISKSGKTANDCVTVCVENSWSGFKAEWLNKPRQSSEASQPNDWFHNNIEVGKRLGIIPQDYGK